MKYLKMLGLAAVAAAALMAFVGAGTASAESTLCQTKSGENCLGEVELSAKSIGQAVLTGAAEIKCDSTIAGTIKRPTTPQGDVTPAGLTWTNCGSGTEAKTVTGGTMSVHPNGDVVVSGVTVTTMVHGVHCHFEGNVTGKFTGGKPAKINFTVSVTRDTDHTNSFFCPSTAEWHADYEVTSHPELYIVKGV